MNDNEIIQALTDAIELGNADRVASLVGNSKKLLHQDTAFGTLLHIAADSGQLEVAKRLVAIGAEINANSGVFNGGAINEAASSGHLDVVKYLLKAGAEMDTSEPERNPLFSAIQGGYAGIVKFLLEEGIDARAKYTGDSMKDMDAIAFAKERGQTEIAGIIAKWLAEH